MPNNLTQFSQDFIDKIKNINYAPIFPQIKEIVMTSISRNFSAQGRFGDDNRFGGGSKQWKPSKRALKQSGQTLRDTGQLAQSTYVSIHQKGHQIVIEAGSNKDYAAIHHFGGEIKKEARSSTVRLRKTKSGTRFAKAKHKTSYTKSVKIGAHTITIVARPIYVLQNEDIEEIARIMLEYAIITLNG